MAGRHLHRILLPTILPLALAGVVVAPTPASAAPSCAAFSAPIRDRLDPVTSAQLLTRSASEASDYDSRGFSHDRGANFKVAATSGTSLTAVKRLHNYTTNDLFYSLDRAEIARAVSSYGYRDQGVAFYATTVPTSCLMAVVDFHKGGIHRFITRSAEAAALEANGWARGRLRFYVGAPTADSRFSVGVMPDTQLEVVNATDTRFRGRAQWLVDNRAARDIRFVTLSGDTVSWDTADHAQFKRAQTGLQVLKSNQIAYSVSPGNHDTAAACSGGGSCVGQDTRPKLRDTLTFNTYLAGGVDNLGGRYASGKVDNTYSTFTAGGLQWLVLNLEMWPRTAAVTWAKGVVARHPRHNVMIVTHCYLSYFGNIGTSTQYGDTTPKYLFDQLISAYPNVRLVFSGHTGDRSLHRTDRGRHGNTVYTMQLAQHDPKSNPLRMLEIDTAAGTMSSRVSAPNTPSYPNYAQSYTGVRWVR